MLICACLLQDAEEAGLQVSDDSEAESWYSGLSSEPDTSSEVCVCVCVFEPWWTCGCEYVCVSYGGHVDVGVCVWVN